MFTGNSSISSGGNRSSLDPNKSREQRDRDEFLDALFSSDSPEAANSMVKIIDIQRSRRKSPSIGGAGSGASEEHPKQQQQQQQQQRQQSWQQQQQQPSTSQEQTKWTSTPATVSQQASEQQQQQQQQQPSGETLSSFESDYDLLVYLGETETEDIVDTERSLDYQDQTWRQSICGGASLAPTIDDSLNDGFLSQASNYAAITSSTAPRAGANHEDHDDFDDLLNTPTPTAATFGSGSPFFTPPTVASSIGGRQPTSTSTSTSTTTTPSNYLLKRADELKAESDDCDNEVSLVFQQNNSKQAKPLARITQRYPQEPHNIHQPDSQANQRPAATTKSVGEKFVSKLFNRNRQHVGEQLAAMGRPRLEPADRVGVDKSRQTMSSPANNQQVSNEETAELDRLLAEMNESLDLKSLARYDPLAGRYPLQSAEQRQSNRLRSQTLNPRQQQPQLYPSQQQSQLASAVTQQQQQQQQRQNTSQSSRSLNSPTKSNEADWLRQQPQRQHQPAAESESSILDEYDGASKILEQMISDQLGREPKKYQVIDQQSGAKKAVESFPDSGGGGDRVRHSSIGNESQQSKTTASSTRKVSTCSSSVASVVLANPARGSPAVKTSADPPKGARHEDPSPLSGVVGGWSRRGSGRKLVKQSFSFDQQPVSTQRPTPKVLAAKPELPASHSFDLVEPTVVSAANNSSSADDTRPPTPPEVDYYNDDSAIVMHEVDHEGGQVIRLEAAEFPATDDIVSSDTDDRHNCRQLKATNETQMDKMKRRTLSSMRSMRNKFNDFITINNNNNNNNSNHKNYPSQANGESKLTQDNHKATTRSQQQRPPQPPKRSSSMGSQNSVNNIHASSQSRRPRPEGADRDKQEQQQRESRSRAPRERHREKQSFGQQIKERLSRSKSRFAKFLKPTAVRRAQSMPSKKEEAIDDSELFLPSDIARNSCEPPPRDPTKRDSFDESLDRHLAASLSSKKQRSASSSSSSSSSQLSGLDTSKSNSRATRPRSRGRDHQSDREKSREKRPSSLISLRRLGSFRKQKQPSEGPSAAAAAAAEDFDSIQVKTSSEIPTAANRKRARKNRKSQTKSPATAATSSSGGVSPLETNQKQLAKTDDYFGRVTPLKVDSDDKLASHTDIKLVNKGNTLQLPVSVGVRHTESPTDNRSAKSWTDATRDVQKPPNRSQSMKSISDDRGQATADDKQDPQLETSNRTVSFSNLQHRRLPSAANTFRPTSACAKLDQPTADLRGAQLEVDSNRMHETRAQGAATPVGLSPDPLAGRRLESTKPPQLEHHQTTTSRLTPIRAKGAAMIEDIKHKCSELFSPSVERDLRGRSLQTTMSPPSSSFSAAAAVPLPSSQLHEPPVRPPRKRGLHQRSKSVSSRPATDVHHPSAEKSAAALDDDDEGQAEFHVVELRATTPGSSLNRRVDLEQTEQLRSHRTQSPVGEKLASFAQQLKHSAADFFHQPEADRKRSRPTPMRAPDETIVASGDLCEWKPVIKTTTATTTTSGRPASSRSFRALGAKDHEKQPNDEMNQRDRSGVGSTADQPDSDSTWESSTSATTGDDDEDRRPAKIVNNQTNQTAADESSPVVAAAAANEPNKQKAAAAATRNRTGTADNSNSNSSSSEERVAGNRLHSSSVDHKFDDDDDDGDKEQDRNNNNSSKGNTRAGKELLHSSAGYHQLLQQRQQQQQQKQPKLELKRDCDAVVSEDDLKIIRHQQQQQQQQTPAREPILVVGSSKCVSGSGEIDENCKHEQRDIDALDGSAAKQQQQQKQQTSMSNDNVQNQSSRITTTTTTTTTVHSQSKPFKFNANLPSPSQLLQEENSPELKSKIGKQLHSDARSGSEKMTRVVLRQQQPQQKATAPQESRSRVPMQMQDQVPEDQQENRLSVYENVNEQQEQQQQPKRREWRRPESPPHVPAKPAHLVAAAAPSGSDLIEAISERIPAELEQPKKSTTAITSNSSDDDWSTEDVVAGSNSSPVRKSPEEVLPEPAAETSSQKTKPKLVAMTSIIHDPIDDLMEARPRISSAGQQQSSSNFAAQPAQQQSRSLQQRRDSNFGTDNDFVDSDDTDSSFAAAAANRQRLVRKFEQKAASSQANAAAGETTRAKFPAFNEGKSAALGRGDSLVKRMARNFDQTVQQQQQQPVVSSQLPPAPPKKISYTTKTATTIIKSFDDDSAATNTADWCDAKSVDEDELAEFLQDFDRNASAGGSGTVNNRRPQTATLTEISAHEANNCSEACSSVSTGADPFVTVADSTLAEDEEEEEEEDDDDDDDDEQQLKAQRQNRAPATATAAAGTTSDDDTLNDEELNDEELNVEDNANQDDDLTSDRSYTSAHGTLPRASQQQQPQLQQQQGKESSLASLIASPGKNSPASECPQVPRGEESPPPPPPVDSNIKRSDIISPKAASDEKDIYNENDIAEDAETRASLLIDKHFKNSLNHIIARRSSSGPLLAQHQHHQQQQVTTGEQQQQRQMSTTSCEQSSSRKSSSRKSSSNGTVDTQKGDRSRTKRKKKKTKKSRELRGLSKLYHALLGASSSSKHRKLRDQDQHSSCASSVGSLSGESSPSVSASESESDGDEDDTSMDDRRLVAAAKKCSQIYEELERILERRLGCKGKYDDHKDTTTSNSNKQQQQQQQDDVKANYEQSLGTIMSTSSGEQLQQIRESSPLGLEDRVSLSSSSEVSSDQQQQQLQQQQLSIPEIRQRKNLQKLYHVVNEICSSEAKFVDTLRLLNVDFRQYISSGSNTSSHMCVPQEKLQSMLKHLPQLQALNENLLAELELARSQWPQTQRIAHVLVKIGPFLKHYSTYIREFESMQQQYQENLKKYPQFAERVREFESSDLCKKLTIQHHILKPIQRIPQYRLLLQQYLHNLKPDDVDYEDTVEALEVVSRVAEHANQSMSEGVNFAKLLALQAKIVGKQRDIVQPGRVFIKEGELMKVCRKQIQPRWFVLLNDALLYLTQVQSSDILFLKNELPLDGCLVEAADERQDYPTASGEQQDQQQELTEADSERSDKEFSVSTRTRSFALIAKSKAERDEWVNVLRRTVEEYMAKRRSFISSIYRQQCDNNQSSPSESVLRPSSQQQQQQQREHLDRQEQTPPPSDRMIEEQQSKQHLLGQMAPIWTPDSRVSMCQLCTSSFSALFRRHHCRACGRVVCSACSSNKAPLIYLKCRAARVCDECFDTLKANIHLYYLPPGSSGAGSSTSASLSDRLTAGGLEPLIGEEELRRLDEHFRTLLKSQFTRTTSLSKLAASSSHLHSSCKSSASKKTKKTKTKPLVAEKENVVTTTTATK